MQSEEFVQFLANNRMPVFKIDDAIKILHKEREYVRLFLHRCMKKRLIGRAERGLYYLMARSNEYEIASRILNPSYISMVSALSYYGLTTQIPRILYVVSPKRHRRISDIYGFEVVFRRIKKEMMFGYHKESDGNIFIADPEKAIVDIYYFGDVNDLDDAALEKPPRIDLKRLTLYAKRSKDSSVIEGVARLLKEHGYFAKARELANVMGKSQREKRGD